MEKGGYYLVLWRVDDIPYHKEDENLFNELHNPKILSLAGIVDVVEVHISRDPIKLLTRWERGKAAINSLLLKNGNVIGLSKKCRVDANNALTIAMVCRTGDNGICISALTRLIKPLTGGIDQEFERRIIKMLKRPTVAGFALSDLAGDVEALDELEQAKYKIPEDKWGDYSEEDIEVFQDMLLHAKEELEEVGTRSQTPDHFKKSEKNFRVAANRVDRIQIYGYEVGKVGHRYWIKKEGKGRTHGYWIWIQK